MIKAVLLDAGGTLLHPDPSVGEIYSAAAARHGLAEAAGELNARFGAAWTKRKGRRAPSKSWWRDLVEEVFPDAGGAFDALFEDLYATFARADVWALYPDVRAALDELKRRGFRLAVASNWDERLPGLLDALGLSPHFDRVFTSHAVGRAKPDPAFFEACLRGLSVRPEEALHAGDDPVEDVEGARAAGLAAILIDRRAGAGLDALAARARTGGLQFPGPEC